MAEQTLQAIAVRSNSPFQTVRWKLATPVGAYTIRAGKVQTPSGEIENHWELTSMRISYTADANAANRIISVYDRKVDGSPVSIDQAIATAITATESKDIILTRVGGGSDIAYGDFYATIYKHAFMIAGDDYLYITVVGNQVGDFISIQAEFRWLNWELGMDDPSSAIVTPPTTPDEPKNWWDRLWHG